MSLLLYDRQGWKWPQECLWATLLVTASLSNFVPQPEMANMGSRWQRDAKPIEIWSACGVMLFLWTNGNLKAFKLTGRLLPTEPDIDLRYINAARTPLLLRFTFPLVSITPFWSYHLEMLSMVRLTSSMLHCMIDPSLCPFQLRLAQQNL